MRYQIIGHGVDSLGGMHIDETFEAQDHASAGSKAQQILSEKIDLPADWWKLYHKRWLLPRRLIASGRG